MRPTLLRSALLAALLTCCSRAPTSTSDAGSPASAPDSGLDAGPVDAGPPDAGPADAGIPDAGEPDAGPPDAGPPDAGAPDAGQVDAGPGSLAPCTFNADCPAAERCACDETTGCECRTGVRGTGQSGLDRCDGGDDCASSLCVEGWGDFYCSGPCTSAGDCGAALPLCSDVAFIGEICIRLPDGGP